MKSDCSQVKMMNFSLFYHIIYPAFPDSIDPDLKLPDSFDSSKSSKSHEKMQKLTCYESAGKQGKSKDFIESSPYLDNQNFNNRAGSCCFQGMYVLVY